MNLSRGTLGIPERRNKGGNIWSSSITDNFNRVLHCNYHHPSYRYQFLRSQIQLYLIHHGSCDWLPVSHLKAWFIRELTSAAQDAPKYQCMKGIVRIWPYLWISTSYANEAPHCESGRFAFISYSSWVSCDNPVLLRDWYDLRYLRLHFILEDSNTST
jgi:hypothetical protein